MQLMLKTPRLLLTPAVADDLDVLWQLWTEPEVRRFLWDDRAITRDEAAAALDDCLAVQPDGLGLWLLHPRTAAGGPDVAGCAGLLPVRTAAEFEPRLAGLIEPIVALSPAVWRRGLAREALAALMGYAAHTLRLSRLAGVTDVPNTASDRMLRGAGFHVLSETDGPRYRQRTYLWEAPSDV